MQFGPETSGGAIDAKDGPDPKISDIPSADS
jgi:hypothetical protein